MLWDDAWRCLGLGDISWGFDIIVGSDDCYPKIYQSSIHGHYIYILGVTNRWYNKYIYIYIYTCQSSIFIIYIYTFFVGYTHRELFISWRIRSQGSTQFYQLALLVMCELAGGQNLLGVFQGSFKCSIVLDFPSLFFSFVAFCKKLMSCK